MGCTSSSNSNSSNVSRQNVSNDERLIANVLNLDTTITDTIRKSKDIEQSDADAINEVNKRISTDLVRRISTGEHGKYRGSTESAIKAELLDEVDMANSSAA